MNNSLAEVHPELVSEWSGEKLTAWANMKRGLKNNTFENYKYMYNTFVRPVIGSKRISTLKKSILRNTTIILLMKEI